MTAEAPLHSLRPPPPPPPKSPISIGVLTFDCWSPASSHRGGDLTALPPQVSYRGAWLIPADVYQDRQQTPSGTDLRHLSFLQRERCRKAMLGVWTGSKLQASIYDILSPKRTVPESDAGSVDRQQTPSIDLRHPFSKEDGAGKRCWECGPAANSKHRFTTSFLQRERCRKAMLGVWTGSKLQASIYDILSPKRTVPESDAGSVDRQHCFRIFLTGLLAFTLVVYVGVTELVLSSAVSVSTVTIQCSVFIHCRTALFLQSLSFVIALI